MLGRALRKLKSASQKNGKIFKKVGPRKQYSGISRSSPFYTQGSPSVSIGQAAQLAAGVYHAPTAMAAAQPNQYKPGGLMTTGFGPCFECGMPGHLRKYCPKLLAGKVGGAVGK